MSLSVYIYIMALPSRTIRTYCQTLLSNAGVASCAVTLLFAVRPQSAHLNYSFGDGKGKRGMGRKESPREVELDMARARNAIGQTAQNPG
jgi:hypothetical protein